MYELVAPWVQAGETKLLRNKMWVGGTTHGGDVHYHLAALFVKDGTKQE